MREGHISSEEVDSTLARFVPGLGRLLLLGRGRFVFVAQGCETFDFSDELSKAATNRDFFLACIERWFAAGTKPDLVAGVFNVESTAVLAIGRVPVSVKTGEASGRVDPSLASFAAEQVFQGRLVSVSVGDVTRLGSNEPTTPCWATSGLLPVDAFLLLPFNGETLKRPANPISSQVAGVPGFLGETQAQTPAESASVLVEVKAAPDSHNELVQEPSVTEPNRIEDALPMSSPSIVPEHSIPVVTADFATNYDDFDELLDGATVWPTAGRNRSSLVQAGEPIAAVPPTDTFSETQGSLVSEEKVAASAPINTSQTNPEVKAEAESTAANPIADAWEPPAPEPSSFARSTTTSSSLSAPLGLTIPPAESGLPAHAANTGETVTWAASIPSALSVPEPDSTELTIMAGDLARIRKTFVDVAPNVGEPPPIGTLIGVYCRAGHFTDSRSQRCLFCQEETDLDTMTSAAAPLLGHLAFDDNRLTPVTGLVLVGRKPTTNDPSITAVAFSEDMMLSRVHFEVRLVDWDVSVVDKQSANGTQIEHPDGRRVAARPNIEVRLEPGSIVRFGNHQATFRRA
jgi:FHA domain